MRNPNGRCRAGLKPGSSLVQKMNVDGLTRENVASHLQKYRLQLKREQD